MNQVLKTPYKNLRYSEYFHTDLPEHWEEKRLGLLAKQKKNAFVDGPFGSDLKTTDYLDDGIPLIQLNNIRNSKHVLQNMKFISEEKKGELSRHLAIPGDIVIAKMAEPVARAAVVDSTFSEYVIVADCVKLSPNLDLVDLRFLIWAINSDCVRINAELVSSGTTRIRINLSELQKLKIPFPSKSEQISIANFLDHEIAKIDTLIEQQQQLIQLLKEKRQAVISHAVTKGLNPNAPMKDSGVEWFREVPAHWKVCRLGDCALKIGSGKTPKGGSEIYQDEGVLFLRSQNIYDDGLRIGQAESVYITSEVDKEMASTRVLGGDILLNITGGSIGRSCIVPEPFVNANVNQHVCIIRTPILIRYFVSLFMKSTALKEQVDSFQSGGNREGLNFEQIRKFSIVLPPSEELEIICDYLHQELLKFDSLALESECAIQLMQERRTALISAAVTGKIDVRNWQPQGK